MRSVPTSAARTAKGRLNVTVRGELTDRARRAGLNLSRVFEDSLIQRLREEEGRRWLEKNREAIAAYNAWVERNGPWNKDFVRF